MKSQDLCAISSYSVVIPAYNESNYLPQCLQALRLAMINIDLPGEVIVTDNNSTDQTEAIARQFGARVVFEPKNQISRSRNAGARIAKGEALIFVDADTLVSEALLQTALKNLQAGDCCGGGATIRFDQATGWGVSFMLSFWTEISKGFRIAAGSFFYCRRDAFEAVGGFSSALYAGEEIRLSSYLKKWGKKHKQSFQIITQYPVITSARKLKHPIRIVVASLICIFIPFSVYSKKLCWYWYQRNEED